MSILTDLNNLFFPRICTMCGKILMPKERYICLQCSYSLPRVRIISTEDNLMTRSVWDFANVRHAFSLFYYNSDGNIHRLVHELKYKGNSDLAFYMGQYLGREAMKKGMNEHCDCLLPIPTTKAKIRQRGYNQAERIAQGISSVFNMPVVNLLQKKFNRETQTHLSFKERRQNAHDLYSASIPPQWRGKRFLIVDDVFTSGSTIGNCALAIEKADPTAEISVITLCLTVR